MARKLIMLSGLLKFKYLIQRMCGGIDTWWDCSYYGYIQSFLVFSYLVGMFLLQSFLVFSIRN